MRTRRFTKNSKKGVQDHEGVRRWLSKKRDDLNNLGGNLTNREIYDCFTKCKIVTDYGLFNVIRTHCVAVDFMKDLEELKWESPQKKFADQLNIFEDMVNVDSKKRNLDLQKSPMGP